MVSSVWCFLHKGERLEIMTWSQRCLPEREKNIWLQLLNQEFSGKVLLVSWIRQNFLTSLFYSTVISNIKFPLWLGKSASPGITQCFLEWLLFPAGWQWGHLCVFGLLAFANSSWKAISYSWCWSQIQLPIHLSSKHGIKRMPFCLSSQATKCLKLILVVSMTSN